MVRFDTLEDGSLVFEKPVQCDNSNYRVDPENPCHLIPVFKECTRRLVLLRVLECGLKRATFHCNKFHKTVAFGDCDACTECEGIATSKP